MKCTTCETEMCETTSISRFTYNIEEISAEIPIMICDNCGLQIESEEAETLKHEAICKHLGVLTPTEIKEIRARAGLTQEQFAELTRMVLTKLRNIEKGIEIQDIPIDRYLRLLQYPENIDRLKSINTKL